MTRVHMIWRRTPDYIELVDAWDEGSIEENPDGWQAAVRKAEVDYSDVRVQVVRVPGVEKLFHVPEVSGEVDG